MKNANLVLTWFQPIQRVARHPVILLAAWLLGGCSGGTDAGSAPLTVNHYFPIQVGGRTVRMQVAVRDAEMQRGLMERRDLGPDDGMLFVYTRPQRLQFWMRNTPTPLDIGFFDANGVLQEVHPLHPFDERPVGSRHTELQFALEMNQGWYRAKGVTRGARIDLKAVAEALKARGFEPWRFGLVAADSTK